jgi:hypothetical protein
VLPHEAGQARDASTPFPTRHLGPRPAECAPTRLHGGVHLLGGSWSNAKKHLVDRWIQDILGEAAFSSEPATPCQNLGVVTVEGKMRPLVSVGRIWLPSESS